MFLVTINGNTCDGDTCIECIDGCPAQILDLIDHVGADDNEKQISGVVLDMNDCTGCMVCETVCPTGSIKVTELAY